MGIRCSHMAGGPFSRDGEMVLKQTGSASGPTYKTPVCSVACSSQSAPPGSQMHIYSTYIIFREVHMYDTFILSHVPLQFPTVSVLLSDVECMAFEFHKHVVEELDEVI